MRRVAALTGEPGRSAARVPGAERLVVALVRGVHGLRGAVRVEVLTDRPTDRFAVGGRLYREGDAGALTIVEAAVDGPGWRLRFAELSDRTAADTLRGAYLEAAVGPEGALGRGEYYWHEVVGATVRDLAGAELGTVVDVYRAGGVDAYVVRGGPFGEFDVPAVRDFVRVFAPRRGEIVVDADALELSVPKPPSGRPPRPRRATRRRPASSTPAEAETVVDEPEAGLERGSGPAG